MKASSRSALTYALAAIFHQPMRDVIAQPFAIFLAMAGCQSVTGFIKNLAGQQRSRGFSFRASCLLRPIYQHLLNLFPDDGIDDRGMLALKNLPFMPDRQTGGVEPNDLVVHAVDPSLAFLHQFRLETAISVARNRNRHPANLALQAFG